LNKPKYSNKNVQIFLNELIINMKLPTEEIIKRLIAFYDEDKHYKLMKTNNEDTMMAFNHEVNIDIVNEVPVNAAMPYFEIESIEEAKEIFCAVTSKELNEIEKQFDKILKSKDPNCIRQATPVPADDNFSTSSGDRRKIFPDHFQYSFKAIVCDGRYFAFYKPFRPSYHGFFAS